jgi:Fe-Mn family superoxide dismutase
MNRREFLARAPAAAAGLFLVPACRALAREEEAAPAPLHELPPLPYAFDALEPAIDARTMEIHHGKHHAAYVANLNKALAGHPDLAKRPLEELLRNLDAVPEAIRTSVRNNGGGHFNHSLFWTAMRPGKEGTPEGKLAAAIDATFGGYAKFKESFTAAAMGCFGSGWAWLALRDGVLEIQNTPNQDSPVMEGKVPILGLDVWEHAYYLKYQNRRAEYVAAWWDVVDWKEAERRFTA